MSSPKGISGVASMPASAGIGAKPQHFEALLGPIRDVAWLEVHAENYMGSGGHPHRQLTELRETYPLSIHGVGLSLGGVGSLDLEHLRRLAELVDRYQPELVSEHVAWTGTSGTYLNDLLPIPYTEESFRLVSNHIDQTQEALGRRILIENPSVYLRPAESLSTERDFLVALVKQVGCGLLFDVNNAYVSAQNMGQDAGTYINSIPGNMISEIHLAGHACDRRAGVEILVDDHGSKVCDEVWRLYGALIERIGAKPTLIEWDTNVPDYSVLASEAHLADQILRRSDEQLLGHRHG